MPLLPWKTARASRISRIVADLQSPKPGGSLVVETGFPTSIVDLFVKHRDRLRKHSARRKSKKKKSKTEIHDSIAQLSSSPTSPPPQMNPTACLRRENLEIDDLKILDEARVVGDRVCESVRNRTETCVVGGGAAAGDSVCMVAVKMFLVAVLALSTKKLVVGVTLSASLLLVLEFVGKRAVRFLKPCANGEAALRSFIHKVLMHLWIVENSGNRQEVSIPKVSRGREYCFPNESLELSSSVGEIQLVESDVNASETPNGIEDETHHIGFLVDEKEKKVGTELLVCGNQRGTRGRLNRRMLEKLVRRKSVGRAIENQNREKELEFRSDRFNHLEADKAPIEEQVNIEEDENLEQEQDGEIRSILCKEEKENGKPQWQAMEAAESCKIQEIEREGSLNYPILVVVVLGGLLGGRILAVVLTTAGCFVMKLNEISRRRSLDPPLKVCC
ncbi:uncharacterized protein LOC111010961 [Momordica charantia]|uniref:Uncharacterized protein LOC111010961 n=1 Tax=Momordica charantia TaxID=3673 RepID=A0A6J1CF69_MOMCH|nr:uncharacterized protein LOC111010961 [Momordica charantia]